MAWLAAGAAPCAAQPRTILVVSEDVSEDVRDSIRIELQLSGRRVHVMSGIARDPEALRGLAAHGEGEVIALVREGAGGALVRLERERIWREPVDPGAMRSPRALALLASALLEAVSEPIARPPPAARALAARLAPPIREARRELAPLPEAPSAEPPPSVALRAGVAAREIRSPAAQTSELPPVGERVAFEALGAVLFGGGLALGGALIGETAGAGSPFPYWAVGMVLGATLGTSAGVLLAGRLTGAEGDPFWTLFAGVLGGGVSALLLWIGDATDTNPDDGVTTGWVYLGAAVAALLPPTLSVLAFELSVPEAQAPRLRLELGPGVVRATF